MFEQSTLTHAPIASRLWSTGAGFAGEALLVMVAAITPMVLPQAAPRLPVLTHLVFPVPNPPPPPPGPSVQPRTLRAWSNRQFRENVLFAPVRPPASAQMLVDNPADFASAGPSGGIPGGIEGGVPGGILDSILSSAHPAPPVPAPPAPRAAPKAPPAPPRVRVGGLVNPAEPVRRVEPVFPPLAIRMRVSGTVHLEGVIGTDGRIRELRVISGHPLLVQAAVDAVRQWLYRPTTLNGDAVEVICPINVTFRLN